MARIKPTIFAFTSRDVFFIYRFSVYSRYPIKLLHVCRSFTKNGYEWSPQALRYMDQYNIHESKVNPHNSLEDYLHSLYLDTACYDKAGMDYVKPHPKLLTYAKAAYDSKETKLAREGLMYCLKEGLINSEQLHKHLKELSKIPVSYW